MFGVLATGSMSLLKAARFLTTAGHLFGDVLYGRRSLCASLIGVGMVCKEGGDGRGSGIMTSAGRGSSETDKMFLYKYNMFFWSMFLGICSSGACFSGAYSTGTYFSGACSSECTFIMLCTRGQVHFSPILLMASFLK